MSKRDKKSITPESEKWFNRFSYLTEYHPFERGIRLYDQQALQDFRWSKHGFYAKVKEAENIFEVNSKFTMQRLLPNLSNYQVTCTCREEEAYCRHAVCATFHMIWLFDRFITELPNHASSPFQLQTKGIHLIQSLEKHINTLTATIDKIEEKANTSPYPAFPVHKTIRFYHTQVNLSLSKNSSNG